MELVVISSSDKSKSEIPSVIALLDAGLQTFHLRKPKFSTRRMKEYIEMIPPKYHRHIIIHSHHRLTRKFGLKGIHLTRSHKKKKLKSWWTVRSLKFLDKSLHVTTSFHSLLSLMEDARRYDYVFLTPVFESISKKGYGSAFSEKNIKNSLQKTTHTVFALGGVTKDRIYEARQMGFKGVALLGSVWNMGTDPVDAYTQALTACQDPKPPVQKIKINPVKIEL